MIRLNVTTGASYQWSPAVTLDDARIGTPQATPTQTTNYVVTVTDENGCTSTDEVTVFVEGGFADVGPDRSICSGAAVPLTATGTGTVFQWSPAVGLNNANIANPIATPSITTTYCVTITGENSTCACCR